jgi:F-type H+-transporting ATPase subunit a
MILAAAGPGFHVPPVTELFSWRAIATFTLGGIEFHITVLTLIMFGMTALLAGLFLGAFANANVVPSGLQNLMEAGVGAVRENVVLPVLGAHGEPWMPFLTAMFFWVFAMNFLEIVPPINFPITSRMAFPAMLSALVYIIFNAVGIRQNGFFGYFKANLFPPGVPKPIYLILTPIEFFSTFVVRPITLAVRLFANMMAGHVMLTIFFVATAYFLYRGESLFLKVLTPFPFALSVVLLGFELFIGLIQAFIITILTAVYIAGASESEH